MPIARKDHTCALCFEVIPSGTQYYSQEVTPWEHHDNERFYTFKAHMECYNLWTDCGNDNIDHEFTWLLPDRREDWYEQLSVGMRSSKRVRDYLRCLLASGSQDTIELIHHYTKWYHIDLDANA
jgi:hypothetical protein